MSAISWVNYYEEDGYKTELKDIKLIKENGKYYLDATYDVETVSEKLKLHIPRIRLPIWNDRVRVSQDPSAIDMFACHVNLGFGLIDMDRDENGHYLTETVVERKVRELTISEIEKKLGYKIKIVNEG